MDDRRFDSLAKALAAGKSRRHVLKGLLGLGGAAVVGSVALETDSEAATRPTPTPKPIKCPGNQTPVGGVCTCPASAPYKCNPGSGPACCTDVPGGPPLPTHTECCDNACCHGTCYGEELCCPTNNRSTGEFPIPPTHRICNTISGPECCPFDDECCLVDGCCGTVCYGDGGDADFCCPVEDFCSGGPETDGACCTGNATCCHGGTDQRLCVDLTLEGSCCDDSDCGDPCQVCSQETHFCAPRCDAQSETCCVDQLGAGSCQVGTCCPNGQDCDEGEVCCVTAGVAACETGPYCGCDSNDDCDDCYFCNRGSCQPIEGFDPATEFCCGGTGCANDRECCQTGDLPYLCLEAGSVCCETNDDCPTIAEICDTERHICVPRCTGSTPQLCNNNFGIYCIPEGETCCSRAEDCPGDCEYCDDNPDKRYCVQRCPAEECCGGSTCYDPEISNCCNGQPVQATCCTRNNDCPGTCDTCDTAAGYCVGCSGDLPQCCTTDLGRRCIADGAECCDPVNCGWSDFGLCEDGFRYRTPDSPPVACGGIPCDPNDNYETCCVEIGSGPCSSSSVCCDGVCQAGTCYASNASTCNGSQDMCDGGGAETCSGDLGCNCVVMSDGSSLCIDEYDCQPTCDFCGGGICDTGPTTCCGDEGVTCYYVCPPSGGGCFTAETRIAMPDGSSRAIADLAIDDALLGADGQINRVVAIQRPVLGDRPLYAIDGSGFFVTASHPFLTDDGWKSIDPAATAREHAAMQVGRLQVGDRVRVLSGVLATVGGSDRLDIDTTARTVQRIEAVNVDPATVLYNLRLDGNQTYFANELLVHNK
jgi:hypothetical protein